MSVEVSKIRADLHTAIQTTASYDDEIEGAVLMGWVCVAEWMDGSGDRWLSRVGASVDPTQSIPAWQREGYLHNALNGSDWDFDAEFEPEDDE